LGITRVKTPIYLSAVDTTTQTFSTINTPQPITVNTVRENNKIISLGNGEFEFQEDGVYKLIMFPILEKTINQDITHFMWLQQDIGAGFVDVVDSNSQSDLTGAAGDVRTITFAGVLSFKKGVKIRFMNSVTNTDLTLVTKTPAAGQGPRIPSTIMSIDKID